MTSANDLTVDERVAEIEKRALAHTPLPWATKGACIVDANDKLITGFHFEHGMKKAVDRAELCVHAVNSLRASTASTSGLVAALEGARAHVEASSKAEHMMDGFKRDNIPQTASDRLLARIDAALASARGET